MNKTKEFTTPLNMTLEEYLIQTHANGWVLQIQPVIKNYLKKLTLKITDYFTVLNHKNLFPKNDLQEGRVKFFNKTKRFGFITTGKKDIFVHISELKDHVRPNDKVIFEIENSHNGLNAVNVRLIDTQH